MKYFSVTSWWNKPNISRNLSDVIYKLKLNQYEKEYDKAKRNMSKQLIIDYHKFHGYHDWLIKQVDLPSNIYSKSNSVIIEIQSPDLKMTRRIEFKNINALYVSINKEFEKSNEDTYMLDEWLPVSDNHLSFELLTSSHNTLFLKCKFAHLKGATQA